MGRFALFCVVLVFISSLRLTECKRKLTTYNVVKFGAVGNSRADDTQAFLKAWSVACGGAQPKGVTPLIQVPEGKQFLVKLLSFKGPCKSSKIIFQLGGNIIAPRSPSDLGPNPKNWITFADIKGLIFRGNGAIDGRGSEWWKQDRNNNNPNKPTALEFANCENLVVHGTKHLNSQRNHISLTGCKNVDVADINIIAPETSPNTDGIDISNSKNVRIHNSVIGTGDDCISIGSSSSFVNITSVICGPGHGISIGSLGQNGATDKVEEIHVKNCTFDRTTNGARIKSWQGGSGYAKKISFENVRLINTNQPIILDQYYCPHQTNCQNQTKAVHFSDISFVGFKGTSSSKEAIILNCSKSVACRNIYLNNINIEVSGKLRSDNLCVSTCINAHGKCGSNMKPRVTCLSE